VLLLILALSIAIFVHYSPHLFNIFWCSACWWPSRTWIAFHGFPAIFEASVPKFYLGFTHWIIPERLSHHSGLSAPLQPRFGSLWLLTFSRAKISVETEEICESDSHIVHKPSEQRLTADWLAPWESDYLWIYTKVSSDWLPSYIKATRPVLEIYKMDGYFLDRPCILDFSTCIILWDLCNQEVFRYVF